MSIRRWMALACFCHALRVSLSGACGLDTMAMDAREGIGAFLEKAQIGVMGGSITFRLSTIRLSGQFLLWGEARACGLTNC